MSEDKDQELESYLESSGDNVLESMESTDSVESVIYSDTLESFGDLDATESTSSTVQMDEDPLESNDIVYEEHVHIFENETGYDMNHTMLNTDDYISDFEKENAKIDDLTSNRTDTGNFYNLIIVFLVLITLLIGTMFFFAYYV